jgi:hypothetical protein
MTRLPALSFRATNEATSMNSTDILTTAEMVSAGVNAYREFLGDDRPFITDEKALVVVIYDAMEMVRRNQEIP